MRQMIKAFILRLSGFRQKLKVNSAHPPRFSGAFPDRETALASLKGHAEKGYDDEGIADISFTDMCRVAPWDYPVLFWLDRLKGKKLSLIDAGGHLGTKYIAFGTRLDLNVINWTVYDLPGIVKAARAKQAKGELPKDIAFCDDLKQAGACDMFLASGLLQYLDQPLAALIGDLPEKPAHILLNKVAMRDGPARVTLERIGPNFVPYQIRDRHAFEAEIAETGYRIIDQWDIPGLAHRIETHPWLGASTSRGYMLERIT
jgi:putative methyltransferase (TIGR04325 family)